MNRRWLALIFLLAGCAPQAGSEAGKAILVPDGIIEDGWAKLPSYTLALPGTPIAADFDGQLLVAVYPYQIMLFRDGGAGQTLPLPGVPKFVHLAPRLVVGLEESLYLPGQATFPYAARDALARADGIFWVDSAGLHRNSELIYPGDFQHVAGDNEIVFALGQEGIIYPGLEKFSLPGPVQEASFYEDLYILTANGLYRIDRYGQILNYQAGAFTQVRAGAQGILALNDEVTEFSRRLDPR